MKQIFKTMRILGFSLAGLTLFLISDTLTVAAAPVLISGKTMGTTYHVKVADPVAVGIGELENKIADRLEQIEGRLSIFRKESELSRFNAFSSTDQWFRASGDFFRLLQISKNLYTLTGGAWDGTIKPLVDLWGFGAAKKKKKIPDRRQIQKRMKQIGFHLLEIRDDGHIMKKAASVVLDLGSVAKGDAVDEISAILKSHNLHNHLIEIGGEVYASGTRQDGNPWRVGINQPIPYRSVQQLRRVARLKNKALATSGDYRNFFLVNGKRFSHVIDPKSGWPVSNGVVSVSILANTCAFADGLATAVMVLGRAGGLALVHRLKDVECLIIVQQKDGNLIDYISNGFDAAISG